MRGLFSGMVFPVGVLPLFFQRAMFRSVCTAYEIGSKGNRLPAFVSEAAGDALRALGRPRIVRPTLSAPVVMPDGSLREMSWGFRRRFRGAKGKPIWRTVVNSREDKLESPMWREAFRERRCLIPAVSFFEWVEGPGGKAVPLRFTREDDDWICIAGIWEEGESGFCYSMVTTEPSDFVARVHDRMPAVLTDWQVTAFLSGELHQFGPSAVPLVHAAAPNFLRASSEEDGDHGSLF